MCLIVSVCVSSSQTGEDDAVLPPDDGEEVKDKWRKGYALADLHFDLEEGMAADDAVSQVSW